MADVKPFGSSSSSTAAPSSSDAEGDFACDTKSMIAAPTPQKGNNTAAATAGGSGKRKRKVAKGEGKDGEEDASPKQKRVRNEWSAEEEGVFLELCEHVLQDALWEAVKADGRLAHRRSTGIKVHIGSVIKKLK